MKLTVFLKAMLFVVLVNYSAAAQEVLKAEADSIPTLEEWWKATGGFDIGLFSGISFLPNFKNGHNAITLHRYEGGISTWLNRFPGDTNSIFTWADKRVGYANDYSIKTGDLNGDGITDYIDGEGNIYRGIKNGQPPDSIPIKKYPLLESVWGISDLNNDGYDDINQGTSVLYGCKDLDSLEPPVDIKIFIGLLYKNSTGEFRCVGRNFKEKVYDGFELYRVSWEKGGTHPKIEKLDSIRQFLYSTPNKDFFYIDNGQTLYQSKKNGKPFYLTTESIDGNWNNIVRTNLVIFDLSNDKFTEHLKFRLDNAFPILLKHSIDGDNYEDWCMRRSQTECWFFSGGEKFDSIPRLKASNLQMGSIATIGDVSGDGLSDIAMGYNNIGIFKGKDLTTSIRTENNQQNFSLKTFKTDPSHFTISFTLLKESHTIFSLFDMEGKLVKVLKEGMFEAGAQSFTWDSGDMSQGAYLLQITADGHTQTEKILIFR